MTIKQAAMWLCQPGIVSMIHDPTTKKALSVAVKALTESEHGTNLASLGTDCISRQAAIETFKDCAVNGVGIDGIVDALEQLSPIQPEIVRCGECEYCVHHPSTPNTKRPCDPPQPEMWHCGKNREFKPRVMPHDFCSRGKRREVTT